MVMSAIALIEEKLQTKLLEQHALVVYEGFKTSNKCPHCNFEENYLMHLYQHMHYINAKKTRTYVLRKALFLDLNSIDCEKLYQANAIIKFWKLNKGNGFYPCSSCKQIYNPYHSSKIRAQMNINNFHKVEKGICDE